MKCDCEEFCKRSGKIVEEGVVTGEWFTPYVPSFVEGNEIECKRLTETMKVPIREKS